MQFREQDERNDRAYQTQEHIRLRIPDVTLCSEEGLSIGWIGKGSQPFNDLIQCRKGERNSDGNKTKPLARPQRRCSCNDFTDVYRGSKALHEMPDLIVVITSPAEPVFHPKA